MPIIKVTLSVCACYLLTSSYPSQGAKEASAMPFNAGGLELAETSF